MSNWDSYQREERPRLSPLRAGAPLLRGAHSLTLPLWRAGEGRWCGASWRGVGAGEGLYGVFRLDLNQLIHFGA